MPQITEIQIEKMHYNTKIQIQKYKKCIKIQNTNTKIFSFFIKVNRLMCSRKFYRIPERYN